MINAQKEDIRTNDDASSTFSTHTAVRKELAVKPKQPQMQAALGCVSLQLQRADLLACPQRGRGGLDAILRLYLNPDLR